MITLTGCFRFGDDIELSGDRITAAHLKEISALSGIQFPAGSHGIEYFYKGDAIDPSLLAKIEIPKEKREEILANNVFKLGKADGGVLAGAVPKWWQPEKLTSRIYRNHALDHARFLECFLGEEDGKLMLYLLWMTT
jgi:hypothetical protein